MCIRPITIKNPGFIDRSTRAGRSEYRNTLAFLHNTDTQYIQVPCGSCYECAKKSQMALYERASIEAETHFVFFQTLTIAPRHMSYLDMADETLRYFDYGYFQKYLKMIRKYDVFKTPFKYIAVVEYGGHRHRPHMHVAYFVPKDSKSFEDIAKIENTEQRNFCLQNRAYYLHAELLKLWRLNKGTRFKPVWDNLCDYSFNSKGERNYDFVAVEDTPDDKKNILFYISKYCTKFDDWAYRLKRRIYAKIEDSSVASDIWSIVKPRVIVSKGFGLSNIKAKSYIQQSIAYSLANTQENGQLDGWKFIIQDSGKLLPLSRYYIKHFVTVDNQITMWYNTDEIYNEDDYLNIELEKRERRESKFKDLIRIRNGCIPLDGLDSEDYDDSVELI